MSKQQAFETVAKIIFERANGFIFEGNPAFDSERTLLHICTVMEEWGYRSPVVIEYYEIIKKDNDGMREMGMEE